MTSSLNHGLQKLQTGHNPKRRTSGACRYWIHNGLNSCMDRSQKMTLAHESTHPSPPLTMPRTGLHGEQSRMQCLHGGLNWQVSWAQRIPASSHTGYGHPFRCHRHVIMQWKDSMIIQCHPPHIVWTGTPTSHWRVWGLACRTITWNSPKRLWHMPKLYNIGPKYPHPHCWMSHASWQNASRSCKSVWSHLSCSLMLKYSTQ